MGLPMRIIFLLFFVSITAFSQTTPQIQVINEPKTIEDFDHQFKGCQENSECDQVMGLQLTRWRNLINKLKDDSMEASKKAKFVELFRAKEGIPAEFYTSQKSQAGFKPMLFDSPCKNHNPKDRTKKVLKGTSFVIGLTKDKAKIWRDQTIIEVPTGELVSPQPIAVYNSATPTMYYLPINDQPLFIKNNSLHVLREDDGFFYDLIVAQDGTWKVDYLDFTSLSTYEDKRSEATCPKDTTKLAPPEYGVEFCKNVWNDDLKKTVVVKMHLGCVI
jgi:hypothetical protein